MSRVKIVSIGLGLLLAMVLAVCSVFWYRAAHEAAMYRECLSNMRQLWAASDSFTLEMRRHFSDECRPDDPGILAYIAGETQLFCPKGRAPYPPFTPLEGPQCPNGHKLPELQEEPKPWGGSRDAYLTTLREDLVRPRGMGDYGSEVLLRLTPSLFDDREVRETVLTNMNAWYKSQESGFVANGAEALGRIKDPRSVETLVAGLECGDWFARMKVAEALGDIGDKRAIEPLRETLQDTHERVRAGAKAALSKLGAQKTEGRAESQ